MREYDQLKEIENNLNIMFNNKIIMITGNAGSFGNKFVKIFEKYKPKK